MRFVAGDRSETRPTSGWARAVRTAGLPNRIVGLALFCILSCGLLASVLVNLNWRGYANGDGAVYLSVGRLLTKGYIPYRDVWDHKPPVIFLIAAAGYSITPNSPIGADLLFLVLLAACGAAWVRIYSVRFGATPLSAAAVALTAFSVLLATNTDWMLMTEAMAFICSSFALFFVTRTGGNWSAFFAGLFIALASLSKQQIVFDGLAVAALLIWTCPWRRWGFAALGGASAYASIILVLAHWGCLREAWECFLFNFQYAGHRRFFAPGSGASFLVPLLLLSAGLACRYILGRKPADRRPYPYLGVLLWFCGAFAVATGGHQHPMVLLWAPTMFAVGMASPMLNSALAEKYGVGWVWHVLAEGAGKIGRVGMTLAAIAGLGVCGVAWMYTVQHRYEAMRSVEQFSAIRELEALLARRVPSSVERLHRDFYEDAGALADSLNRTAGEGQ